MLLRIVSILFPLFAITALGFVVARRQRPDLSQANLLNMAVFTPALIFAALAAKNVDLRAYAPLAGATLLMVAGSGGLAWVVARTLGMAPKTLVPPMMFNNCGNLGLPLAVLALGPEALAPMVVMFAVSNTLHFSFGIWLMDHRAKLATVWMTPSVLAVLAGLAVSLGGIPVWPPLWLAIKMVGDIAVPLMLFALGVRLATAQISAVGFGVLGAVLRPVAGMVLAGLLLQLFDLPERERALLLVFGALPPAVLNFMFAERYHQEPEKVASVVLIGNLAALISMPLALAWALPA